jgi:WYL domain
MPESSHQMDDLPPAQRERLAYIEFLVWFLGCATRKDVLDRFGIATAAGTRDMALYRELAPNNVAYEGKTYLYRGSFKPLFTHDVHRVLSALTSGFGDGDRRITAALLPHAVPARLNQPALDVLATVTRAIHRQQALKLTYHSLKTGPVNREIVPHALVDSGLRWHVRAFDRSKNEFRDLVLTRMENLRTWPDQSDKAHAHAHEKQASDMQWGTELTMTLIPHPSHRHPQSIERDFGMKNGQLTIRVRAAVAGYFLRQWQVDCSPGSRMGGTEYRLALKSLSDLRGVVNAVLAPGFVKASSEAPDAGALHPKGTRPERDSR